MKGDDSQHYVQATLQLALSAEYPAVIPAFELLRTRGLTDATCRTMLSRLSEVSCAYVTAAKCRPLNAALASARKRRGAKAKAAVTKWSSWRTRY